MKLVEINWKPPDRQLRQFGIICLIALPLVGGIWGASTPVLAVLAAVGLLLAVAGWLVPQVLKPAFLGLMILATPIGILVGEVAMLLIYFVVMLPIGLALRLFARDPLQRKIDRDARTYWQPKESPKGVAKYYRQS